MSWDPFDPECLADPYPSYEVLRDDDPVHHHPASEHAPAFWALSRFEDVWDAVRRPDLFSSAQGLTFHPDEARLFVTEALLLLMRNGRTLPEPLARAVGDRLADRQPATG